jgi:hypothetical protein
MLDQQYQTDIHTFWRDSTLPPELLAALGDGWLGLPGHAVDLDCGLAIELARLAERGVSRTVGVDRSS